jgi:hypothetical protein
MLDTFDRSISSCVWPNSPGFHASRTIPGREYWCTVIYSGVAFRPEPEAAGCEITFLRRNNPSRGSHAASPHAVKIVVPNPSTTTTIAGKSSDPGTIILFPRRSMPEPTTPPEKPVTNPKSNSNPNSDDLPDHEIQALIRHNLSQFESAMNKGAASLSRKTSKRSRAKRSGLGFVQATLRYAQDDLSGAIEIMRDAIARADQSMGDKDPYRFYMHAVFADWLAESGAFDEARGHIDLAWNFVTTEPTGQVYLKEVTERKSKVDARLK